MLVLGLETSTSRSSVALVDGDRVVASASLGVARRHGEFLAPAIAFCLEQADLDASRIHGVAVGVGPGLFTGLRVGLATAATFAGARHLPVVGLSGLDVLAFSARYTQRPICAVLDARRGELFWAFYRSSPGGVQRDTDPVVGRRSASEMPSTPPSAFSTFPAQDGQSISGTENSATAGSGSGGWSSVEVIEST